MNAKDPRPGPRTPRTAEAPAVEADGPLHPPPFPDGTYSGASLRTYRLKAGLTMEAVGFHIHESERMVNYYETERAGRGSVNADWAEKFLDGVDRLVNYRAALVQEGLDRENGVFKEKTWTPRGTWRTPEETKAILLAQDRGGEAAG